jgi:endonuclease III
MEDVTREISLLKRNYPKARYYLNFSSPLELMVAAILSAQTRDESVNAVTPKLFAKYKSAKDYSNADQKVLSKEIGSITFAEAKSANIIKTCIILVEKYGGVVPHSMEDLVSLPGIGRKTANTILINAFNIVEGIPVDTHVIRLSYRLGWTKSRKPEDIEHDLMKIVDKNDWKIISYLLKSHGKEICRAPVPLCNKCFLKDICPKAGVDRSL